MTIIVGTGGGAFANKNCPQGQAFEQFFQMPGVCPGVCPGGMLAAGIDSHIKDQFTCVLSKVFVISPRNVAREVSENFAKTGVN